MNRRGTSRRAVAALALLALAATGPGRAVAQGTIKMENVAYGGWPNNLRISNGDAELIVTLDVGPRIMSYRLKDGKNVLKEFKEQLGKSGEADWVGRGGHRLWTAPEDLTRTYAPDNSPVESRQLGLSEVLLKQSPDTPYGVQKEMEVHLAPKGTSVTIVHRITNVGKEPVSLAPWALTVLDAGGVEVIPMPPRRPHPGPPANAKSPADYAADRQFVMWPYFDFSDSRWHFGRDFITLRQDPSKGPTKIGMAHRLGWAAYLNHGTLFVKRIPYVEGAAYPDGGCNFETFSNEDMVEMESLGPLVTLKPGEKAEHTERWELFPLQGTVQSEQDITTRIVPLVSGK